MARMGASINEYDTAVVVYECESCGDCFTVCPAPLTEDDSFFRGCLAFSCDSYDATRDIDWLWDTVFRDDELLQDG